jgi:hypothetical protein
VFKQREANLLPSSSPPICYQTIEVAQIIRCFYYTY